ncbi:hypothetical protein DVK85_07175 [Flavobacterium arcticum]|uniref:Uncharacterized protein n=1 Tax=Flavobacterium arcticum TaxID=1784713 RepID=A0A345HBS8_9FLAO|nr:hypothetical protein DVK85_07175 [Flavobacterium arcticum]
MAKAFELAVAQTPNASLRHVCNFLYATAFNARASLMRCVVASSVGVVIARRYDVAIFFISSFVLTQKNQKVKAGMIFDNI